MIEIVYSTTPIMALSGQRTHWGIKTDLRSKSYLALGVTHPRVPAATNTLLLSKDERQQCVANGSLVAVPLAALTITNNEGLLQEMGQRPLLVQVFRRKTGSQQVTVILDRERLDRGDRAALLGVSFDPAVADYLVTQLATQPAPVPRTDLRIQTR